MNRRVFLGAMTAMTATLATARAAFAEGSHQLERIGVQLYTVRDAMKADVAGTLAKVAKVGYNDVEFAGYFDHTPKQIREILDQNHLQAPSAHVEFTTLGEGWPKVLEAAHTVGHKLLVCPWIPEEVGKGQDRWQKSAEAFNKAGEASKKAGIQFAYHNHNFEFKEESYGKPYDLMLTHTDAGLVKFEADLFWMILSGNDPIAYMEKYPGRFAAFHVKDMARGYAKKEVEQSALAAEHMEGVMMDVGSGGIDFAKIFALGRKQGVKYYFVEHDNPKDPFASIANSYRYLHGLKF